MARSATSPELALYRSNGQKSLLRAVILKPPIVYRARINQTFTTYDQVLDILYDGGTGDLADVLPDTEVWIGSTLDAHDKGICRLRDKDATHFYISETSEIQFADNDYVTILAGFGIWARPVRIVDGDPVMDETEYDDQHTNWDPMPNMGADQVVELTGVTVETTFHAGSSFCPGSSIASYAWSCPTASATSDPTLADFTVQFDTGGTHLVYLTVTGANGKTFFGVRNVFVVDDNNPAFSAVISNPGKCDVDSGGWEIEPTLFGNVDLADVHERAKIILFSEDHYGSTTQAIGPVPGSENIWFVGWISKESNHLSAEQGNVTFTANGAAYWMTRIPSWPDGVELTSGTPDWTSVQNLTVDLGVYHFLRWRSTITRVMDVTLSGDTRISQEVSSSAQDLWSQLQEMTWAQIYARPGVNALNQLSIQVHPCLIPTADRAYPTVMAITKEDYADGLDFERSIVDEVGIVDMSGVQVTGPGEGNAYFALAPGHSLPHYGAWDIQPNLLLESQAQVITLAGLWRSHQNNPFKEITIPFKAAIRLIDCFPNQKCTINVASGDNVRGWAYSGGLIPTAIQLVQDPQTGHCHTKVTFEAETNESQSRVGDTPGSGDPSHPSVPSLPPIVIPPIVIPGTSEPSADGPTTVIMKDATYGLVYTIDFDNASPHWLLMNGGLTVTQYRNINFLIVCPNGSLYCGCQIYSAGGSPDRGQFVARAPSIGSAWTVLYDYAAIYALYPDAISNGITNVAFNPLVPETVAWIMGQTDTTFNIWVGGGGTYIKKGAIPNSINRDGVLTYGLGYWRFIGSSLGFAYPPAAWLINADGSSVTQLSVPSTTSPNFAMSLGNSTTVLAARTDSSGLYKFINNFAGAPEEINEDLNSGVGLGIDDAGLSMMGQWDTGAKGKSSDGGASWSALASLPPGYWEFQYAGPGDSTSRWIAVGGSSIRYSPDFGSTWQNKEGDITSSIPSPNLGMPRVVGY